MTLPPVWNTTKTFIVGEPLTAAEMNKYSRDNALAFANRPWAKLGRNAVLLIPNNTWTVVPMNVEHTIQDASMHPGANPERLVAVRAGFCHVSAHVMFASNATGFRGARIKTSAGNEITKDHKMAVNGEETPVLVEADLGLSANDYVILEVYQNSGGALNIQQWGIYTPVLALSTGAHWGYTT